MSQQVVADRYRLEREIGRGGMGAVWLGHDLVLERDVALKRVGHVADRDEADAFRVEREARVAAMVSHPNVVGVLDLVEHDAEHWLVMEYVDSETLAQRIRREGPIDPDELAPILRQAVAALATAHDTGVIHRDVKPSNILLGHDGCVKLGDFGIAVAADETALTRTGMVTGSPGYMAPEVASGTSATPAADMWSLGATAFHALAGRSPYHSTSEELLATLYRVVHEEPPRTARAGWLDPLLRATMHRDPRRRWTAHEALAFLAHGPAALESLPSPPREHPGRAEQAPRTSARARRPAVLATFVAVVAVLLAGGLWLTGWGGDSPRPQARADDGPAAVTVTTERFEPSAAGMEAFVRDYLRTVAREPAVAYSRLTPSFQAESDDFEGYLGWWQGLRRATVTSIEADPETLRVSYDVAYRWTEGAGKGTHDSTTLVLAFDEQTGEYRIADEL
jgi:hypothetical protein